MVFTEYFIDVQKNIKKKLVKLNLIHANHKRNDFSQQVIRMFILLTFLFIYTVWLKMKDCPSFHVYLKQLILHLHYFFNREDSYY